LVFLNLLSLKIVRLLNKPQSEIQLVELDFDELLRASFIPGCLSPLPFLEFQQFPVLWVRSL
jgi:hypothetical protein